MRIDNLLYRKLLDHSRPVSPFSGLISFVWGSDIKIWENIKNMNWLNVHPISITKQAGWPIHTSHCSHCHKSNCAFTAAASANLKAGVAVERKPLCVALSLLWDLKDRESNSGMSPYVGGISPVLFTNLAQGRKLGSSQCCSCPRHQASCFRPIFHEQEI
jgi:hypothetical protein